MMGRGGGGIGDPFAAILGSARGLLAGQSAQHRPELLNRGQRCDLCELHDYAPEGLRALPGGRRACLVCFRAGYITCTDCGRVEGRDELRLYERELAEVCGFELDLCADEDPLCRTHAHGAYRDHFRDGHGALLFWRENALARLAPR